MNEFIVLLIFGALWCFGIYCLFAEGYILEPFGNMVRKKLPTSPETYGAQWYTKFMFDCPPCMGSLHGFFIAAFYYDWHIAQMFLFMVCLCGMNYIIKSILFPEYE